MTSQSGEGPGVKSALHASLESKKDQSYYYAHQPRGTREAPAPPPIHQAIKKVTHVPEPSVESISRYQFLDTEKYAKVNILLENLDKIGEEAISTEFKTQSFTVDVREYKPNTILRLFINHLEGDIDPEGCKVKKLENKIVVYLAKLPNDEGKVFPWRNLKK